MAKKILFVEDEKPVYEIYAERLKGHDIELIPAVDGTDGLNHIQSQKPDLIILDLILPKMHGFEFLEKIKADPATRDIPVIILSNLSGQMNRDKAKNLGAADYFVKTEIKVDEMVKRILEHLS